MAFEETGMGIWQHKVIKMSFGTQKVYESIKNLAYGRDHISNHYNRHHRDCAAFGPIFAIIPVTNPTSTILYKTLIVLKAGTR